MRPNMLWRHGGFGIPLHGGGQGVVLYVRGLVVRASVGIGLSVVSAVVRVVSRSGRGLFMRTSTITIGENKGSPRIWLEGKWLSKSGFESGRKIRVDIHKNEIVLEPDQSGKKVVSSKRKGTVPVIDLNTAEISEAFKADTVQVTAGKNRITITPAYTAVLMSGRELAMTEASMFSGGGFLSLAAKLCGFTPKMAVEINPVYAGLFEHNHPEAEMFNMSVSEVPYGDLARFKPIGLFTAGIPCEPFSQVRRVDRKTQAKRDNTLVPETHELGDMTFWCLRNIEALNPHTVVLEEVPGFLKSGAGQILLHVLGRLYRHVGYKVMKPSDYGCLTGRGRAVIVAQDRPIVWPVKESATRKLGDIFDPEPHAWFNRQSKSWLYEHWEKQAAKGNNFMGGCVHTADSPSVAAITKRYFAQQGGNPVVAHPTKKDTHRWLTLNEVKRLHGVPDDYFLGTSKTIAGEVIGQGVVVDLFQKVISSVTA